MRSGVEKIRKHQGKKNMFLSLGVLLVEHKIVAYVDDDAGIGLFEVTPCSSHCSEGIRIFRIASDKWTSPLLSNFAVFVCLLDCLKRRFQFFCFHQ